MCTNSTKCFFELFRPKSTTIENSTSIEILSQTSKINQFAIEYFSLQATTSIFWTFVKDCKHLLTRTNEKCGYIYNNKPKLFGKNKNYLFSALRIIEN